MTSTPDTALPNILIIYADQMRADMMGCAGNPVIKTPYLDRLVREGVRFENAFVSYPLCCPFRASFLTGKYAHATSMYANHFPIDTDQTFLAPLMNDAGYRTGYIGKWHLDGGPKPGFVPPGERRLGFQHFVGFNRGHQYLRSVFYRDTDQPYRCARYEPDYQTDHVIEFMDGVVNSDARQPFLAYVCYGAPHYPVQQMPDYLKTLYDPAEVPLPPGVPDPELQREVARRRLKYDCAGDLKALDRSKTGGEHVHSKEVETEAEIRQFIAHYYAMITNVDHNVGRLLNWLDAQGIADDTLVVFMSDHGDMLGQHGYYCGLKRTPYKGAMQVPFIMRYPRRVPAGQTATGLIDVAVDTMPTLLDLCGIDIPDEVQGQSYLPLLDGTAETVREAVMYEIMKSTDGGPGDYTPVPERGIRTRDWLYVRQPERRKFLFDLRRDPDEMNNLVEEPGHAERMDAFDRIIADHMQATGDDWDLERPFPPPDFLTHAEADAQLENEILKKAVLVP